VFTVSGLLGPGRIGDGLLESFPTCRRGAFHISLMHPGTFFVRFSEPRWFNLVAAQEAF
jgi:hypothetical protein